VLDLGEKTALIYDDAFLQYDFGSAHPLRPIRFRLTFELMRSLGMLESPRILHVRPSMAKRENVLLFHEEEYVRLVESSSKSGLGLLDMGDTPAFRGCFEASLLVVGASLQAVDLVMRGEVDHAFNIGGGFHHAHPGRASGFCIFNDAAVCIAYLKREYGLKRVMYFDMDAHQGDGVMYGFYSDPSLLDIDLHEDGMHLFPGTGFASEVGEGKGRGFKVNIPYPPLTHDEAYLHAFNTLVPPLTRSFKPEIILVQCGADSHANDELAHLNITTRSYIEIIGTLHKLAHELSGGRLVMFGGGGYNVGNVARCWTAVLSQAAEVETPEEIPEGWRKMYREYMRRDPPTKLHSEEVKLPKDKAEAINSRVEDIINEIKKHLQWKFNKT